MATTFVKYHLLFTIAKTFNYDFITVCVLNQYANGRNFEFWRYFGSYINYYKSETFLMPYKTCIGIFINLLQEIVSSKCLKRFFLIK